MLSYIDAIKKIESELVVDTARQAQLVAVGECHNRVLAEDLSSPINVPPADNTAMDGIAVCLREAISNSGKLAISQVVHAGDAADRLEKNTAARVFTGAEIPHNADTVIMQEDCVFEQQSVSIMPGALQESRVGQHIRRRGQDIAVDSVALPEGTKLKAQHLALLCSMGLTHCLVYTKVKVAVFSTGNELVQAGSRLETGQIYDSNRLMITQLCDQANCQLTVSAHLADDPVIIQQAISAASREADIIFSCGGVSVGDADYLKACIKSLGELSFWKVNMKPGKPIAFGRINHCAILGLPGNPVSAFITFLLFGKAALRVLQCEQDAPTKSTFYPSQFARANNARTEFLRVTLRENGAEPFQNQSSGVLSSLCASDALAIVPANTDIRIGDLLEIIYI